MIYYGLVLRYKKRKKDVCIMTLKRITASKEKATRLFLWMVGILTIPCVLYSVYFNFFWLPSQTYSAAEQEMVDAIVEISQRYGDEAGQVTVNFQHFPEKITILNGTVSMQSDILVHRCVNTLLLTLEMCVLLVFATCILIGISSIFIHYVDEDEK